MKLVSLIGRKFGRLTVISRDGSRHGHPACLCQCQCGNFLTCDRSNLFGRSNPSCGCYRKERMSKMTGGRKGKHGHARILQKTRTYNTWRAMKDRCYQKSNNHWKYYGGKGIQVCARWFNFPLFLADMGERPTGKSIDRIDGNLHY